MAANKPTCDYTHGSWAGMYVFPQIMLFSVNLDAYATLYCVALLCTLLIPAIRVNLFNKKAHKVILVFSVLAMTLVGNLIDSSAKTFWATLDIFDFKLIDVIFLMLGLLLVSSIFDSLKCRQKVVGH